MVVGLGLVCVVSVWGWLGGWLRGWHGVRLKVSLGSAWGQVGGWLGVGLGSA